MDCNCNCFGIAASSKRPVKRYNLLVPEIFPKEAPPFREDLDASTERKLKKLYEYLEKNLHRGPKVSRRLARRINKELSGQRWGFVRIAVAAYIYLLEHLRDSDSALFAKEVVCQRVARPSHFYEQLVPVEACFAGPSETASGPSSDAGETRAPIETGRFNHSVVGVLLHHSASDIRVLGAQLLTAFTRQQVNAEHLGYIEAFISLLCEERHSVDDESLPHLQAACLAAVQEYLRLCVRASAGAKSLGQIVRYLLRLLDTNKAAAQALSEQSNAANSLTEQAAGPQQTAHSPEATQDTLAAATVGVVEELSRLAQSPAEGKRLIMGLLRTVHETQGWGKDGEPSSSSAFALLHLICRDEQQHYQAFSLLVGHVSTEGLTPDQRLSVVRTTCARGLLLPTPLATAAVVLAIKEWSPLLTDLEEQQSVGDESSRLASGLLAAVEALAGRLADAQHLLEVLGGVAAKAAAESRTSTSVLRCMVVAVQALPIYTAQAGTATLILPQLLMQELTSVLLQWQPDQQVLAHRILQQLLVTRRLVLRDAQVEAILSAVWHQVTRQSTPAVFAAASATLYNLLTASEPQALPRLALFAESILDEAARGSSTLGAAQLLALDQFAGWIWGSVLKRLELTPSILTTASLGSQNVSQLRIGELGLEQTGPAPLFEDARAGKSSTDVAEALQEQLDTSERKAEVRSALEAACSRGSHAPEQLSGSAVREFVPLPLAALQPKVPGAWYKGMGSRTRTATNDQDPNQRINRLRNAIRSRTTDQAETSAPWGIRTANDFAKATMEASQPLQRGGSQVSIQEGTATVVGIIDRLLSGIEEPEGSATFKREERAAPFSLHKAASESRANGLAAPAKGDASKLPNGKDHSRQQELSADELRV